MNMDRHCKKFSLTFLKSICLFKKFFLLIVLFIWGNFVVAKPTFNVGASLSLEEVIFSGNDYDKNGGTYDAGYPQSLSSSRFSSGANIGEASIKFYGDLNSYYDYKFQINFMNRTPVRFHYQEPVSNGNITAGQISYTNNYTYTTLSRVTAEEVWLRYKCWDLEFKIGQMHIPFGLSWSTDRLDQLFMEKPNLTQLLERRHFGINFYTDWRWLTVNAAVVAKEFNQGAVGGAEYIAQPLPAIVNGGNNTHNTNSEEQLSNDKYAGLIRVTVAPLNQKDKVLHFGFNAKYKTMHGKNHYGNTIGRFPVRWYASTELKSRQSSPFILTTHAVSSGFNKAVDHFYVLGVELAGQWKSFHAQLEAINLKADYGDVDNETYKAIYIQGGFLLTGESRYYNFKRGVFENPVPNEKCGAYELVFRYSHINLDNKEAGVAGSNYVGPYARLGIQDTGKVHSYGIGLNWFYTQNLVFRANCLVTKFNFRKAKDRTIKGIGIQAVLKV